MMDKLVVKTVDGTIHEYEWDAVDFIYNKEGIVIIYNLKSEENNLLFWALKENILYMRRESVWD